MFKKKQEPENNKYRELCFGTRTERSKLRSVGPVPRAYPGPFEYYRPLNLIKNYPNKRGYTLIASRTPRDKDFRKTFCVAPPLGVYDIDVRKPPKQNARPFGFGSKLTTPVRYVTPAPPTYSFFKRTVKVCTAFNHDRIAVPYVKIICGQFNRAYCVKCEKTPIGDYWHKDSANIDVCRPCMAKEIAELKKCSTNVLDRFRKKKELSLYTLRRYCEFFHEHNCTKAAVQHMPTKDLIFKLRKENYLASYGL